MTDAPERIWLLPHVGIQRCWVCCDRPGGTGHGNEATEYVRADLVKAMASFARHFAEALDVECDFMTPPAPIEDGFEARRLARAALRSTEASHD